MGYEDDMALIKVLEKLLGVRQAKMLVQEAYARAMRFFDPEPNFSEEEYENWTDLLLHSPVAWLGVRRVFDETCNPESEPSPEAYKSLERFIASNEDYRRVRAEQREAVELSAKTAFGTPCKLGNKKKSAINSLPD